MLKRALSGERTNAGLAEYTAVLKRAAAIHSARFVRLVDVLDTADLADDGMHINDSGYIKLANQVLAEL